MSHLQQNHLCSILDGCSRYIVNWDLRESMTEADIEIILERAKELHPEARPRIISDNGPHFIANRTEKSNAGTNRSKESASGRERRCRRRMRGGWWRATWDTTTMSA